MSLNKLLQQVARMKAYSREATPEEVERARKKIVRSNISLSSAAPFVLLSGMIMTIRHTFDHRIPTAATRGLRVYWNPHWVLDMNPKQINYVNVHEIAHNFLLHTTSGSLRRLQVQDPEKFAAAIDHVVNNFIEDCDPNHQVCEMPTNQDGSQYGTFDRQYKGMSVYEVFKNLPAGGGGNGGFDSHEIDDNLTPEEKKELDLAIQTGKRRASAGSSGNRDFDDNVVVAKRNWLELLAAWLYSRGKGHGRVTWKRPSRRFIGMDIYQPARAGNALRCAVFSVDTSGSIGGEELSVAINTAKEIVRQTGCDILHIIYWDHDVQRHETYRFADSKKLSSTKPSGGGGTRFDPVYKYMKEQEIVPDVMVNFTDGYVGNSWGEKPKWPVIWVISTDVKAPYGDTLSA